MSRMFMTCVALASLTLVARAQSPSPTVAWYRGNLHSHTINSDGDSSAYDVMAWYKRNGYHFLAITDHNTFTDPAPIDSNRDDAFLLIGAEEITNDKAVHVNAIGVSRTIPAQSGSTVTALLQASIDATRALGGLPIINHPNFRWAFTAREMLPLQRAVLLEIASGFPRANHQGNGVSPSSELMWDQLLSANMRVFGVAVDDVHNLREEFSPSRSNPGQAWVMVRAASLTREAILAALEAGEFYASTGVLLKDIRASEGTLSVEVDPGPADAVSPPRFRTVFIGKEGRVLAASLENPARYSFAGDEGYVRARIEDSNGRRVWTQPVFIKPRG